MNTYQCTRCDKTLEFKNKIGEGVRTLHACEDCNDITTWERVDHSINELTDAQREYFREQSPQVRVTKKSNTTKHIHLDDDGDTMCNHGIDTRLISITKYPLGYLDWCQHCLNSAKNPKEDIGGKTKKEACKKALQIAQERLDGDVTERAYRDLDITPSYTTIKAKFGSWSNAKEASL